jgi:protein-tyrosine-phosphatase
MYHVLFLCTGNSARSIMAEAILNQPLVSQNRFKAFSAGSYPKGAVHPLAIETMQANNLPAAGYRSKSWSEFSQPDSPRLDFVFTVCDQAAAEPCPVWPGQPMTAHWGIADPAAVEGSDDDKRRAFRGALTHLRRRIDLFVSLPLEKLDRLSLQKRLQDIGRD